MSKSAERQPVRTRDAFLKIRWIEKQIAEGNFKNFEYFLKYSGQQALDYALEWAAYYGKTDLAKLAIDAGACVEAHNNVALQMACENNHLETMKYLLSITKHDTNEK